MADEMSIENLGGLQKAAILLIALGPEMSSQIFKHLKEEEKEERKQTVFVVLSKNADLWNN